MYAALVAAIGLAAVHLCAGRLHVLHRIPRSRWLSLAGGASVAYVFVHIMPELDKHQRNLSELDVLTFLEHHVYLVTLIGFAAFYGLERLARSSRQRDARRRPSAEGEAGASTSPGVFWIHAASFGIYNALIGYLLLHRESPGTWSLILFATAIGLHFLVNDDSLRDHHRRRYDTIGRWLLSVAVLLGWGAGVVVDVHEAAIATLFAFVAGGIILNVIKEELPEERASRWWAFAVGATAYTLLLLAENWITR